MLSFCRDPAASSAADSEIPGSALVSSAGEGVPAFADFLRRYAEAFCPLSSSDGKVRFGGTPKPALGTSALPRSSAAIR